MVDIKPNQNKPKVHFIYIRHSSPYYIDSINLVTLDSKDLDKLM